MKHHSNDIRLPKDLSLFPKTLILNHIHFGHSFMKNLKYDFYLGQVCVKYLYQSLRFDLVESLISTIRRHIKNGTYYFRFCSKILSLQFSHFQGFAISGIFPDYLTIYMYKWKVFQVDTYAIIVVPNKIAQFFFCTSNVNMYVCLQFCVIKAYNSNSYDYMQLLDLINHHQVNNECRSILDETIKCNSESYQTPLEAVEIQPDSLKSTPLQY